MDACRAAGVVEGRAESVPEGGRGDGQCRLRESDGLGVCGP